MKRRMTFTLIAALVTLAAVSAGAQDGPIVTIYWTDFHDTTFSSTINGDLLPVGSFVEAYDPDGVLCGLDTVTMPGAFGYMPVYGDDLSETPTVDEGAEAMDVISFRINGRSATVVSGDPTWVNQTEQNVVLSVANPLVALAAITLPSAQVVAPGHTISIPVEVRNDGDGLDFYSVKLTMSQPSGTTQNDWEAIVPDSFVYANPSDTVPVSFSIRAPLWGADTTNLVAYTVYSNIDSTIKVEGSVWVYKTITDVEDDPLESLPGSFVLSQNYPNPFNPNTTIPFELSSPSRVSFVVYDALGRTVESSDMGYMTAGRQEIEFDGRNLSSGVYFYRVITETTALSRKMILLK